MCGKKEQQQEDRMSDFSVVVTGLPAVLLYCQTRLTPYAGVEVENFSTSWRDGRALLCLAHSFNSKALPPARMEELLQPVTEPVVRLQAAIETLQAAGVQPLVEAEDMTLDPPDWHCVALYLAEVMKFGQDLSSARAKELDDPTARREVTGALKKQFLVEQAREQEELAAAPPACGTCGKMCTGKAIKAAGQYYHFSCFQCKKCHRKLGQKFQPVGNDCYCDFCCKMAYNDLKVREPNTDAMPPKSMAAKMVDLPRPRPGATCAPPKPKPAAAPAPAAKKPESKPATVTPAATAPAKPVSKPAAPVAAAAKKPVNTTPAAAAAAPVKKETATAPATTATKPVTKTTSIPINPETGRPMTVKEMREQKEREAMKKLEARRRQIEEAQKEEARKEEEEERRLKEREEQLRKMREEAEKDSDDDDEEERLLKEREERLRKMREEAEKDLSDDDDEEEEEDDDEEEEEEEEYEDDE